MQQGLAPKIGTFLIMVGLGILLVFIAMDLGGMLRFDLFFISLILIFIGFKLRITNKPVTSTRFKTLRNIHGKIKENRASRDSKTPKTYTPEEDFIEDYDQNDFTP